MAYYLKLDSNLYKLGNKSCWNGGPKSKTKSVKLYQELSGPDPFLAQLEYFNDTLSNNMARSQPFYSLRLCSSLEEFEISNIALNNDEVFSLSQALSGCHNLRKITLNNVRLSDQGLKLLSANLLSQSSSIEEIHLPNNDINNTGLCTLVESLRKNVDSNVQVIDLHDNNLQEQGLVPWLAGESCGLKELFKFLEINQKVKKLNLENNKISSEFFKSPISSLEQTNTTLIELKVSSKDIEPSVVAKCHSLAIRNKELSEIQSSHLPDASSSNDTVLMSHTSASSSHEQDFIDILGVSGLPDLL